MRAHVGKNADALLHAASLLGGRPSLKLAQDVLDGLADCQVPSRRTLGRLDNLLDLLLLKNVHDLDKIEAARFATVDPASPVVEAICLLADGLHDAISTYRQTLEPILAEQVAA
ncbi:hypothetical protein [uncultured Marivita sp.]|uniref:hypothetical protein n=1 Tax=uncultured Marivita sp. TaxID=888080 RepID=UPI002604B38C|nr:hypothetical protein [uncultured Marivita sp.]